MNKIKLNLQQNKKIKKTRNKKLLDEKKLERMFKSINEDNNATIEKIFLKYPHINDPNFQSKITLNKDFFYPYDGQIKDINKEANEVCFKPFTISSHQKMIKSFMSYNTPYNGLLLYHGLGSGKTCTAIGVTENMRKYMELSGNSKRIIIIASPNVQENFKLQLFDYTKLKKTEIGWEFESPRCEGQNFLDDLKHIDMRNFTLDDVIRKVNKIINKNYVFMGYIEFANYIEKTINTTSEIFQKNKDVYIKQKLNKLFKNRLVVIDEIHNIRRVDDSKDKDDTKEKKESKKVASNLLKLVYYVDTMKLLFLSATPMYNDPKEIVFLLNILNMNDNRALIKISDVFDKNGNFKIKNDKEVGKELLILKSRGYVSYVRGENPYSFPFGIFPNDFNPERSLKNIEKPVKMFNGKIIKENIEYTDLYINNLSGSQERTYYKVLEKLQEDFNENKIRKFEESDSFNYNITSKLLEALNMSYPIQKEKEEEKVYTGERGLKEYMTFKTSLSPPVKNNFRYKNIERYGRIFAPDQIQNYSTKIYNITQEILKSKGICLVYSQYIDSGIIPVCLALEELGFKRYGEREKSLFYQDKHDKDYKFDKLDSFSMKRYSQLKKYDPRKQASYVVISGNPSLSPSNKAELLAVTKDSNMHGYEIKVVIISVAGSEGLDFRNLRQVHILEPWYNRNRLEQVIGRGIRNCSHKNLPLEERNVCIYQHATISSLNPDIETADMLNYRLSELKEIKISKVKRALKENSIDCNLNYLQTVFAEMRQEIDIVLSNKRVIKYRVGDKPFTSFCDYDKTCYYTCNDKLDITTLKEKDLNTNSLELEYYTSNFQNVFEIIKELFKINSVYKIDEFINNILHIIEIKKGKNTIFKINEITKEHIIYILNEITTNQQYIVKDKYNRSGHITSIDYLLLFTPFELSDKLYSSYDFFHKITKKDKLFNINKTNVPIMNMNHSSKNNLPAENVSIRENEKTLIQSIYEKINDRYNVMIEEHRFLRGEEDVDKHFYSVYTKFIGNNNMNNDIINQVLCDNLIEYLSQEEYFELAKYILTKPFESNILYDYEENFPLKKNIENYFRYKLHEPGTAEDIGKYAIYLFENGSNKLYIIDNSINEFREATITDRRDFSSSLNNYKKDLKENLNSVIGYISTFKKDKTKIFKTRLVDTLNPGARCDQKKKPEIFDLLNKIIGREIYDKNDKQDKKLSKIYLCLLQEMYLRYYNYERRNDKIWFITENDETLIF